MTTRSGEGVDLANGLLALFMEDMEEEGVIYKEVRLERACCKLLSIFCEKLATPKKCKLDKKFCGLYRSTREHHDSSEYLEELKLPYFKSSLCVGKDFLCLSG